MIAPIARLLRAGTHELHAAFGEKARRGNVIRRFSGKRSDVFRFGFELPSDEDGLAMVMRRWGIGPFRLLLFVARHARMACTARL